MNERMRELVRQAGGHFSTRNLMSNPVQHREAVDLWDDKIEKFAELIVQKCITIVNDTPIAYDDYRSQVEEDMRDSCRDRLKNYFGVE